jgi:opacity protein-like surface antigen
MKMKICMRGLALIAVFLVAGPASAAALQQRSFEMTPFYGYRFGGDLGRVEGTDSVKVAESPSYGIMLDWEVEKDAFLELRYSLQRTELQAEGSVFGPGLATVADMDLEHFFLGGTYQWENTTQFRPFVSADLGVVRLDPSGSARDTRFAFALGGGVKMAMAKHLALRFDGRWVLNRISGETEIYCGSPGQCLVTTEGTFFSQIELSGGLSFRF